MEDKKRKEDGNGNGSGGAARRGSWVGWSVAYYAILVAGAVAFRQGLWPLTESGRALAKVG